MQKLLPLFQPGKAWIRGTARLLHSQAWSFCNQVISELILTFFALASRSRCLLLGSVAMCAASNPPTLVCCSNCFPLWCQDMMGCIFHSLCTLVCASMVVQRLGSAAVADAFDRPPTPLLLPLFPTTANAACSAATTTLLLLLWRASESLREGLCQLGGGCRQSQTSWRGKWTSWDARSACELMAYEMLWGSTRSPSIRGEFCCQVGKKNLFWPNADYTLSLALAPSDQDWGEIADIWEIVQRSATSDFPMHPPWIKNVLFFEKSPSYVCHFRIWYFLTRTGRLGPPSCTRILLFGYNAN